MQAELAVHRAIEIVEHETGVVIPVYFHPDADPAYAAALLGATVRMYVREVANPQAICLSVDGGGLSLAVASEVVGSYGVQLVHAEPNRGKLASVRNGMAHLLQAPYWRYLAVVDCDGDHFANELLNFVRCAEHVAQVTGSPHALVLGERMSRHRPLGFLRGEQEALANALLLDALHYAAALAGRPLPLQFVAPAVADGLPDFHSGYKLFSRATAEQVFLSPPNLAGCEERAYYRHACEAVMVVEALQRGAFLATVNRRTFDEQPISSFARLDRAQLAADMIIWPCRRLGAPGPFVAQWLANHLPRLLLGALVPQGRAELATVRDLVLQAYGLPTPTGPADAFVRLPFI
ncbi:MAG: hypothetical protein KJZ93_19680 [Caldilineaceae bacterium]|nr:hypothetical protein [Caldilineaceae bacterium]